MSRLEFGNLSEEKRLMILPTLIRIKLASEVADSIQIKHTNDELIEFYVCSVSPSKRYLFGKTSSSSDTYMLLGILGNIDQGNLLCKYLDNCCSPINWGILRDVIWDEGNEYVEIVFWDYDSNRTKVTRCKW